MKSGCPSSIRIATSRLMTMKHFSFKKSLKATTSSFLMVSENVLIIARTTMAHDAGIARLCRHPPIPPSTYVPPSPSYPNFFPEQPTEYLGAPFDPLSNPSFGLRTLSDTTLYSRNLSDSSDTTLYSTLSRSSDIKLYSRDSSESWSSETTYVDSLPRKDWGPKRPEPQISVVDPRPLPSKQDDHWLPGFQSNSTSSTLIDAEHFEGTVFHDGAFSSR